MDSHDIDVLFVILDAGLLIENSAVFQAQVTDQLIALKKSKKKVALLCASKNSNTFNSVVGRKLNSFHIPIHLVPDKGLIRNIFLIALALNQIKRNKSKI